MADWKKLATRALLADGRIDLKATAILREELFADERIDKGELEFLFDLRRQAESTVQAFNELFFLAVKKHILANGVVSVAETKWLRQMIRHDGPADDEEKKLLEDLKREAREVCPEFDQLYEECM